MGYLKTSVAEPAILEWSRILKAALAPTPPQKGKINLKIIETWQTPEKPFLMFFLGHI